MRSLCKMGEGCFERRRRIYESRWLDETTDSYRYSIDDTLRALFASLLNGFPFESRRSEGEAVAYDRICHMGFVKPPRDGIVHFYEPFEWIVARVDGEKFGFE